MEDFLTKYTNTDLKKKLKKLIKTTLSKMETTK